MDIKQTIQEAVVDMMKKVKFIDDKNQHRYETIDGEWLQGVSSVSSIVPKPWLSAWGAKEAVKFLGYSDYEGDTEKAGKTLEIIRNFNPVDFIKFLKEAKGASFRKSKEALVDGKAGHLWMQRFVLADIRRKAKEEAVA